MRTFGTKRAVDGVDLRVARGTVYGVLGPNGAGKTTTIRMLATLLRPTRARRACWARRRDRGRRGARSVTLTGQLASVDEDLTGRENLVLIGRLLGFKRAHAKARADELLEAFGLAEAAGRQVKEYSGGMRRSLDIAASIVVPPAADVPRRAHHRARPALAQPGVGDRPGPGRRGDDRPAVHAVPRRGRPARRADRRHRPRAGHRRGHAGRLKASVGQGALRVRLLDAGERPRPSARWPGCSEPSRTSSRSNGAVGARGRRRAGRRALAALSRAGSAWRTSRLASPASTRSSWP